MDDQKALELLASLLKVMREHGALEELYVPIEVTAEQHAERGRDQVADDLRRDAAQMREIGQNLDVLIQWVEQKLQTIEEGKKYIPF